MNGTVAPATRAAGERAPGSRGMRRVHAHPLAAGILLGAVSLCVGTGCGEESQVEVAGPELLNLGASQVMVNVETYVFGELGTREARLVADTAFFLEEQESAVSLRGVRVTFFDASGRSTSTLTARRGRYDFETGNMEAEQDVMVVDAASSRRLETPRLRYLAEPDELHGDTSFVFYRGAEVVRGTSFESDPALGNIRIQGPSGVSPASDGGG